MSLKVRFTSDSTLAQQCFEQLQAEILAGVLRPGEKLKVEPIKERFGIGQSPVREALSRLVAFGLVEVVDNKGFRVTSISEADIRDTYDIFTRIENMALGLAIQRGDDAWEAGIAAALHALGLVECKGKEVSYAVWAERNYEFHRALIAGCNSPTLLETRKYVYMKFDRYCRMAYHMTQHTLELNHQEHKKLARLVLDRDAAKAQEVMGRHIYGALEDVVILFKKHNLV